MSQVHRRKRRIIGDLSLLPLLDAQVAKPLNRFKNCVACLLLYHFPENAPQVADIAAQRCLFQLTVGGNQLPQVLLLIAHLPERLDRLAVRCLKHRGHSKKLSEVHSFVSCLSALDANAEKQAHLEERQKTSPVRRGGTDGCSAEAARHYK